MAAKKPRLSLTKTQIQAGIGAELLALCQSITSDGILTDEEIHELRVWLDANRSFDIPAIELLVATVERILADGKVTLDERKELFSAIETILPPEARRVAVTQRKTVEAEEKAQEKQERDAQKQQEREEKERKRPLLSANFMVAGVHYEGRGDVVRDYVDEGEQVFLVRDPKNKYSQNAIEVRLSNGMQIGFVPEDYAPDVAPLLDLGNPHVARVTKMLTGGRVPIPIVQAYLYRKDAQVEGLVFSTDVPPKRIRKVRGMAGNTGRQRYDTERDDFDFQIDMSPKRHHSGSKAPRNSRKTGCGTLLLIVGVPVTLAVARLVGLLG